MKKIWLVVLIGIMLASCGNKQKKRMSGEDQVGITDFLDFFPEIVLPIALGDSILTAKVSDSTLISDSIFNLFIGDTIFRKIYPKKNPQIYALGKMKDEENETYLLVRTKGGPGALYLIAFTPDNKYADDLLLMAGTKNNEVDAINIDSKFVVNLVDQYKDLSGTTNEFSQVYAYTKDVGFMMILQNGLQEGEQLEIRDPIDTLPADNKFSGDYGKDTRNFITIRDGKSAKDFVFYMYMDKGGSSDCEAELKGEASFVTKDSAVYLSKTDPCVIGFKFGSKSVRINESTVCGNRRPSGCTFNAYYTLSKPPAKPKKK